MAREITLLKGVGGGSADDSDKSEMNVERMLVGFLRSLLQEQNVAEKSEEKAQFDAADGTVGGHA